MAVGLEFIGHGAFGIMTNEAWIPYYDLFGIPASTALGLMPLTGAVDIVLGLLVLLRPTRAALLYMAFWGLYTATLRPLTGEGGWEFVERAYNFGGPLALLLLHGWGTSRAQWLERIGTVPRLSRERAQAFVLGFRAMIAAYLIGHGALGLLTDKQGLVLLYDSIGLTGLVSDPRLLNEAIGSFEITLGLAVLALPASALLVFVCAWKLTTESLFVTAGAYGAGFEDRARLRLRGADRAHLARCHPRARGESIRRPQYLRPPLRSGTRTSLIVHFRPRSMCSNAVHCPQLPSRRDSSFELGSGRLLSTRSAFSTHSPVRRLHPSLTSRGRKSLDVSSSACSPPRKTSLGGVPRRQGRRDRTRCPDGHRPGAGDRGVW